MQNRACKPKKSTRFDLFAVTQPGIEQVTAGELEEMGYDVHPVEGGVEFKGFLEDLYRTNLYLRTANRLLVRVGRFRATAFPELVERFSRYPWELYGITPEISPVPPRLRVTCHKSKLYHSGAVAQRALAGIEKRVGTFPDPSGSVDSENQYNDTPLVIVRFFRDWCTVSVDSSGPPLYKRGYRVHGARAPLRENLAAALLLLSRWHPDIPLLDPFCGSGTIPIEAAMIGLGRAPGMRRSFSFFTWKNFDEGLLNALKDEAKKEEKHNYLSIYASDIDKKAIEAARMNAEAAGLNEFISFEGARFHAKKTPPSSEPGWIVTNPPYGRRISSRGSRRDIYRELADALMQGFQAWGITCLAPSARNNPLPGIKVEILATFSNSGFRVRAVEYSP